MDENQPSTSTASTSSSLNPADEHFDPLSALYAKDLKTTGSKHFVKYDNIGMFESALQKRGIALVGSRPKQEEAAKVKAATEAQTGTGSARNIQVDTAQRRFLPHQMPIKGTGAMKPRHNRNLMKQMEDTVGPLAALYKMMKDEKQITVYTRKEHGVRGSVTGYVIAFDKHWNLLMRNCCEIWKRRKFKFSETEANLGTPLNCLARLRRLGIKLPETEVKSLDRKYVQIKRKLNQVMIRGEQIVLVTAKSIAESAQSK